MTQSEPEAEPSRTVLITGGNRGIGLAIARAFLDNGDRVAITHRGSAVPDGMYGVYCDVTSAEDVDAAFTAVEAELGLVEVLVSNAGITEDGLLLRMPEQSFERVVDANLTGAYRVAQRASKGMLRLRRGRMIFISSVVGFTGNAGQANYAASKAGLLGLSRSIARELGSRSITANVVAPGYIETDMTADTPPSVWNERVPLGRLGQVSEVAAAVVYLASPLAAYVSGIVLPVDGGLGMGI